jgi:hypothetical protein
MKVALPLLFLAVSSVVSAQERNRGIYIDAGFGFGGIHYLGGNTKTAADAFNSNADKHLTMDLSIITFGWALKQNFYLVGTIAGVGDAYYDSDMNQSQISIYMYGIGTKFYPLPSKKYLQLGLDLGTSHRAILYNKTTDISDLGFSTRASIGWDLDPTMTGLSLILGGDIMANFIESDASLSYAVFVKLLYK